MLRVVSRLEAGRRDQMLRLGAECILSIEVVLRAAAEGQSAVTPYRLRRDVDCTEATA